MWGTARLSHGLDTIHCIVLIIRRAEVLFEGNEELGKVREAAGGGKFVAKPLFREAGQECACSASLSVFGNVLAIVFDIVHPVLDG